MNSLANAMTGAGAQCPELTAKEIAKQIKPDMLNKTLSLRIFAAEIMQQTLLSTKHFLPLQPTDLDQNLYFCFRALDCSDINVQDAAAKLTGKILVSTQLASAKQIRKGTDVALHSFTLEETMQYLSNQFHNAKSSLCLKIGIIKSYAEMFKSFGAEWMEANYIRVARHLLTHLLNNSSQQAALSTSAKNVEMSLQERLALRKFVRYLMSDVIAKDVLGEQAQVLAIRELSRYWLKMWPPVMKGETPPNSWTLIAVLEQVSELIKYVGSVAQTIEQQVLDPLTTLLSHPNRGVQLAASVCLQDFCSIVPHQLTKLTSDFYKSLQQAIGDLGVLKQGSSTLLNKCRGNASALGAISSIISQNHLAVSYEYNAWIFSLATQLLKSVSERKEGSDGQQDVNLVFSKVETAWILIGALMKAGPNFVSLHLSQLLLIWRSALPKPQIREVTKERERSPNAWVFMLKARLLAISSLLNFLKYNHQLVTTEVAKRIVALLNHTWVVLNQAPNGLEVVGPAPFLDVSLNEVKMFLRASLFHCYRKLKIYSVFEGHWAALLRACIESYTSADEASIAGIKQPTAKNTSLKLFDVACYGMTSSLFTISKKEADIQQYVSFPKIYFASLNIQCLKGMKMILYFYAIGMLMRHSRNRSRCLFT